MCHNLLLSEQNNIDTPTDLRSFEFYLFAKDKATTNRIKDIWQDKRKQKKDICA